MTKRWINSAGREGRIPVAAVLLCTLMSAAAFVAGLMVRPFESAPPAAAESGAPDEADSHSDSTVRLDSKARAELGLQCAAAELRPLRRTIVATGSVRPDETRLTTLRAMARGRIERVHVRLGDRVRKGEPLVVYDNVELGEAIGQYLSDRAELARAQSEADVDLRWLERARELFGLGAVARAELERREAEHRRARASVEIRKSEVAKTEEKLHRFGLSHPEISRLEEPGDEGYHREASLSTIVAPFEGVVTRCDAAAGESVSPEDELVIISDLSTVWVLADIYEKDVASVRPSTPATLKVDAYPSRTFPATISYVSDSLDPSTRTAKVRCEVANRESLLKLEMFATISIPAPAERQALAVPESAIQRVGQQWVSFVPMDESEYRMRVLALGERVGGWMEVLDGLRPGDQVVTEGSFFLKSEIMKKELGHHHD
jgi:cobalt-zinc-cadmium efflux system membrane fusion protein